METSLAVDDESVEIDQQPYTTATTASIYTKLMTNAIAPQGSQLDRFRQHQKRNEELFGLRRIQQERTRHTAAAILAAPRTIERPHTTRQIHRHLTLPSPTEERNSRKSNRTVVR